MSGPRGGLGLWLVPLSGEPEPEERSEDSDEALLQFKLYEFQSEAKEKNVKYLAF